MPDITSSTPFFRLASKRVAAWALAGLTVMGAVVSAAYLPANAAGEDKLPAVQLAQATTPGSTASAAGPFSPEQKSAIEQIIKEYLLSHPEVMMDVQNALEAKMETLQAEKLKLTLKESASEIFRRPNAPMAGNPNGDVTVVEFFDYNCGYCKRAMLDMMEMIKSDPKLKFVLKEFPVLGEGSVQAAQVAAAVRMQDKTGGKKYLEFHQKLLSSRGQVDKARALAVAKEVGLDVARIEKDMASDEVRLQLEESMKLAEALGLNGTPSYVVGGDVVVGAVGLNTLKQRVNNARCGQATC